ncbi:MAG: pyrroloquinoline quinone-dependent dehydrogenase [Vicinamibacteria bacterium]
MKWLSGAVFVTMFVAAAGGSARKPAEPQEPRAPSKPRARTTSDWPSYGNDRGGMRYAPLTEITRENVRGLKRTWTYRHGDVSDGSGDVPSTTAFEATPILVNGKLIFCTPFNRVIALDPYNGGELWVFDPEIDLSGKYENQLVCRGVSAWTDARRAQGEPCRTRVFTATNDARLFAIDAETGARCTDFAANGEHNLNPAAGQQRWKGEYQVTSPPAIIRDLVVVGSAVADNQRIDAPSGLVRAFDTRSGELRWAQDLAPPDFDYQNGPVSETGHALGTPNVWAVISVDEELGLIYLPTGNPGPDFYRGKNLPLDHYGSSVVALHVKSGEVAWLFQTVHHDLWDYDVPAQPALFTFYKDGQPVPALAQATKTGHLFILNRKTGEPLIPVREKPVPQGGVMGEWLSPTQPVPDRPPPLGDQVLRPEQAYGVTAQDRSRCRELIESMRSDGIFTPPSLRGTVLLPGSGGGLNWSGVAIDPDRRLLITNATNLAWMVRLFPSENYREERTADPDGEVRPQDGTPYGMTRSFLTIGPLNVPCNPPPWGRLHAIDLTTGGIKWSENLGTVEVLNIPLPGNVGAPSLGGAIVTKSGLAFIAGTIDDFIRAFDVETGEELWRDRLPAGGQATPMTYAVHLEGGAQRQFVVIAAGGQGRARTTLGDYLVAYALQ